MNNWKFNILIGSMVIMAICLTALVISNNVEKSELQPRDVFAELQLVNDEFNAGLLSVNDQLIEVRNSVNHARELASKNEAIVAGLNQEIADLKLLVKERNGHK